MKPHSFRGRTLVHGKAEGEVLKSAKAFTFAHGVDPGTGSVTDVRSDLRGSNVRGKVLVYPFGKGSTTASSWFLETARRGNAPAAIVPRTVDLSAVIGSVLAKLVYGVSVPVLTGFPDGMYGELKSGDRVSVDGSSGELTINP